MIQNTLRVSLSAHILDRRLLNIIEYHAFTTCPFNFLAADYVFEEHLSQSHLTGRLCGLENKNLFPPGKFVFLQNWPPATHINVYMHAIWMKFLKLVLLISYIILERHCLHVACPKYGRGLLDEITLSHQYCNLIRRNIPNVESWSYNWRRLI